MTTDHWQPQGGAEFAGMGGGLHPVAGERSQRGGVNLIGQCRPNTGADWGDGANGSPQRLQAVVIVVGEEGAPSSLAKNASKHG